MGFQDNLRMYRERLGINAKDFAASIGVKYSTYASYENLGREPKYATLIKIAAALHVSIDDLLGYNFDQYAYWEEIATHAGFKVKKSTNGKRETVELTPSGKIQKFFQPDTKEAPPASIRMDVDSFIEWSNNATEKVLDSDLFLMLYAQNLILQALYAPFPGELNNEED